MAVNCIVCAVARRAHAAFRISIALGSSSSLTGGIVLLDALACFEAFGCWASAGAVRSRLNARSSAHPIDLGRNITANDDKPNRSTLLSVIMGSYRIQTSCWR